MKEYNFTFDELRAVEDAIQEFRKTKAFQGRLECNYATIEWTVKGIKIFVRDDSI